MTQHHPTTDRLLPFDREEERADCLVCGAKKSVSQDHPTGSRWYRTRTCLECGWSGNIATLREEKT